MIHNDHNNSKRWQSQQMRTSATITKDVDHYYQNPHDDRQLRAKIGFFAGLNLLEAATERFGGIVEQVFSCAAKELFNQSESKAK